MPKKREKNKNKVEKDHSVGGISCILLFWSLKLKAPVWGRHNTDPSWTSLCSETATMAKTMTMWFLLVTLSFVYAAATANTQSKSKKSLFFFCSIQWFWFQIWNVTVSVWGAICLICLTITLRCTFYFLYFDFSLSDASHCSFFLFWIAFLTF